MKSKQLRFIGLISLVFLLIQPTFAQTSTQEDPLDLNGTFAVSIDVETGNHLCQGHRC